MKTLLKTGLASALALATAMPAVAQQYRPTPEYQRQQEVYDAQRSQYEDQRGQYEERRQDYREARRDSREARRDYERRLAEWNRAQVIYDRRYGRGAYSRVYARPVWDQTYWSSYEAPPYAGYYGRNTSATNVPCSTSRSGNGSGNTVAGGVIGALAGAVLGSQVASRGARTEGAVLGGVAGAVIGGAVGNASDNNRDYKCDSRGPYFSYDDTVAYREGRNRYASSYDSTYYERQRCRLAAAPVDAYGRDIRYVRVCPDDQNRFRITG
jgi:Glycine zipper 2TM domain